MAETIKTEQTLLTGSIPAIAGIEDPSQARMVLYQAGRPVHAPLDKVGLATNADVQAGLTAETRSRVINGAFQISQENGNTASSVNNFWAADQWFFQFGSTGTITVQRVQSTTPNGSANRYRATITVADAALGAVDYLQFGQMIEGIRVADFRYGTASARQSILRFGFKGPAGTYSIYLRNSAGNRTYLANFTISAGQANIDTEQVFVIPGDTTGTWLTDTGIGIGVYIVLAAGTNWQGAAGWTASGAILGTSANTNGMATAGNVFEFFDVSLHLDPLATGIAPPWVMPDEAEELMACRRYYISETYTAGQMFFHPLDHVNVWRRYNYRFIPPMRIAPSITVTGGTSGAFTGAYPGVDFISTVSADLLGDVTTTGAYSHLTSLKANARM